MTYKDVREAGFGLYDTPTVDPSTWREKPGAQALRRLLALLKDTDHEPRPLAVRVDGGDDTLRTALLSKSDGTWLLCLWRSVDLYRWNTTTRTGQPIPVDPLQVSVTFDQPRTVAVSEPSVQDTPTSTVTAATCPLTVDGGLLVLGIS